MKKRRFSILLNIATLCLCIAAVAIGVYSVKNAQLTITGTISFVSNSSADVVCKIWGIKNSDGVVSTETTPFYLSADGISQDSANIRVKKDYPNLSFGDLSFAYDENDNVIPINFSFQITNISNEDLAVDLNFDNFIFNNIQKTMNTDYLQIIRPKNSTAASDDSVIGSATISFSLNVVNAGKDTQNAVSGNLILNINKTNETDSGFVLLPEGEKEAIRIDSDYRAANWLKSVPTITSDNSEKKIVIPSYLFDGTTYKKITGLAGSWYSEAGDIWYDAAVTNLNNYEKIIISNGMRAINLSSLNGAYSEITFPRSIEEFGCIENTNTSFTTLVIPYDVDYVGSNGGSSSSFRISGLKELYINTPKCELGIYHFYNINATTIYINEDNQTDFGFTAYTLNSETITKNGITYKVYNKK